MIQARAGKTDTHSTAPEPSWRHLRLRFFGSLVIFGFSVGMMIGRLTIPERIQLTHVIREAESLRLVFDYPPQIQTTTHEGSVSILANAFTQPDQGQLQLGDSLINWRLRLLSVSPLGVKMTLGFVALRPLQLEWEGKNVPEGWELTLRPRIQANPAEAETLNQSQTK